MEASQVVIDKQTVPVTSPGLTDEVTRPAFISHLF